MITKDYNMSYIKLENITFSYSAEEEAVLKDVSLEIEQGKVVCIVGDNGCGKSTLFRILNALSYPQKGNYFFKDKIINEKFLNNNKNSKIFHKEIGYLFQNPDTMLFNGSVYDEIAFGPRQMGLFENQVKERVEDCMNLLDIKSLAKKAPYHLSGGQKKRVAMASVIALNPEVYILDEPFEGLDNKGILWFESFIRDMKNVGKTIIISTHKNDRLGGIIDKVVEL